MKTKLETQNMSRLIWQNILGNGISKIPAPLPKATWYRLYEDFDAFSNSVSELPEVMKAYNDEAKAWQRESGLGNFYGGYFSPYFRDTSKQEGKDKKRIIQVCEPYYRYLSERQSDLLNNGLFRRLLEGMMAALYSSCASFRPALCALKEFDATLYDALNPEDTLPPVSLRLLSYDADPQLATNPHLDKSAITIIVDADDPDNEPRLIFGATQHQVQASLPKLSSFKPFPTNAEESLIFMGAAPREGGLTKFLPLPHAVRPFDGTIRHSAVFFWHLPNVEMQNFDTKIEVEDDLGLTRKTIPKKPTAQSTNLSGSVSAEAASFLNRQAIAYDSLLSVYEARHEVCHDIRRTVLSRVLDGLGPNLSALDVGCGAGAYLSLMADRGLDAEGVDLSSSMVSAAQARSGRPVRCADFRSESFDRQFDLVFAQAFVHLFPKAEVLQVINKLKSLAKKRVYFSTSIALQPSEGWEEKDGAVRFRSRYTASEFASLIAQCSADGLWRAHSFELVDPDNKHWVQVILDRD